MLIETREDVKEWHRPLARDCDLCGTRMGSFPRVLWYFGTKVVWFHPECAVSAGLHLVVDGSDGKALKKAEGR